ncbi:PilZ domain-containing protein [Deferrisoma sp.]
MGQGKYPGEGRERRRDPRVEATFPLRVSEDGEGVKAESINISTRGLYCRVPRHVNLFSKLRVALDLPMGDGRHETLECDGVVVRVDPERETPGMREYRLAIYFLNLDAQGARVIEEFLAGTQN